MSKEFRGLPSHDGVLLAPDALVAQPCSPVPLLTLIITICVAGIDKLFQAVCLPGNLQEQWDGVILPIMQVEHGFEQTGLPCLWVCKTK